VINLVNEDKKKINANGCLGPDGAGLIEIHADAFLQCVLDVSYFFEQGLLTSMQINSYQERIEDWKCFSRFFPLILFEQIF